MNNIEENSKHQQAQLFSGSGSVHNVSQLQSSGYFWRNLPTIAFSSCQAALKAEPCWWTCRHPIELLETCWTKKMSIWKNGVLPSLAAQKKVSNYCELIELTCSQNLTSFPPRWSVLKPRCAMAPSPRWLSGSSCWAKVPWTLLVLLYGRSFIL